MSSHEEGQQLIQTVEMFEVITQTQPLDYQSLEILKEAYLKLGRHQDALGTSKRIASAYVQLGQLSSAILEYESILQGHPDDPDVRTALAQIEQKATSFAAPTPAAESEQVQAPRDGGPVRRKIAAEVPVGGPIEDGRDVMYKLFVDGKHISAMDFEATWPKHDAEHVPGQIVDAFLYVLAQRQLLSSETALKILCDRTRCGYILIEKYDVDVELARSFPRELCQRWCVLPFDRMGKSLMVATANPFNKHVVRELERVSQNRLIWYLTQPQELSKTIRKIFR